VSFLVGDVQMISVEVMNLAGTRSVPNEHFMSGWGTNDVPVTVTFVPPVKGPPKGEMEVIIGQEEFPDKNRLKGLGVVQARAPAVQTPSNKHQPHRLSSGGKQPEQVATDWEDFVQSK